MGFWLILRINTYQASFLVNDTCFLNIVCTLSNQRANLVQGYDIDYK